MGCSRSDDSGMARASAMIGLKRRLSIAAVVLAFTMTGLSATSEASPECHVHRSKEIGFRERDSKDVLEISIGTGPCYAATLAIVIRTKLGEILYSYVAPRKRYTAVIWQDAPEVIEPFIPSAK